MTRKVTVAICALAFLIPSMPGRAQQQHLPTIADCLPGQRLAVQDTGTPALLNRLDPQSVYAGNPQAAQAAEANYQASQTQAPSAFVTGCVSPQPVQPVQQQYGGYQ